MSASWHEQLEADVFANPGAVRPAEAEQQYYASMDCVLMVA